jgi:N-acyl-L-homoserine lactone synthetase
MSFLTSTSMLPAAQPSAAQAQRVRPRPRFCARLISPRERQVLDRAFRLRHAVFVRELGWVPAAPRYREMDRSDGAALHFGVFSLLPEARGGASAQPVLAGYARVLLPETGFMLLDEFAAVIHGTPLVLDLQRSFEVSRVVVRAHLRGLRDGDRRTAADHLVRAIAGWALARGRDQWLSVCELRHMRALRWRGFPCVRVGRVVEYQPHVPVCAVRVDLMRTLAALRAHRPRDYVWYREGGSFDG